MSDFDGNSSSSLPPKSPQSDDLRTRIAAFAAIHIYNDAAVDDNKVCSCGESETYVWPKHFANVLIRELGLRRESPQLCPFGSNNYRYVTKWSADE